MAADLQYSPASAALLVVVALTEAAAAKPLTLH
jgi:hypothetical protein